MSEDQNKMPSTCEDPEREKFQAEKMASVRVYYNNFDIFKESNKLIIAEAAQGGK